MKIAVASDHAGFNVLQDIKANLIQAGHQITDYGPENYNPDDDYPDYIIPAAKAVATGHCQVGIIFGGSGQGEAMAANRIEGIRCAVYYGSATAKQAVEIEGDIDNDPLEILKLSRKHNLANMLSLATRFLTYEEICQAITIWLNTPAGTDARHIRRIHKLDGKKND